MDRKPLSPVSTDTPPALALDALAAAINDDHEAVEHMARSTLDRARAAGDKLIQAKAQVEHGQWLPWLAANCPRLATRTAQAYMKLAREWDTLVLKSADSAHLTVDGALKLLAAPAEPEWAKGLTPDEKAELDRAAAKAGRPLALSAWKPSRNSVSGLTLKCSAICSTPLAHGWKQPTPCTRPMSVGCCGNRGYPIPTHGH